MFLVFVDLKTQDNSKAMFHTCPTLPQLPLAEKLIERKKNKPGASKSSKNNYGEAHTKKQLLQ